MSRERDRIAKKMEKNPVVECNKIQKKFYPELFKKFEQITDPRNKSYIEYSAREMLGTIYYKGIAGISSMQEMTRVFNDENVVKNLYTFMGTSPNVVNLSFSRRFLHQNLCHFEITSTKTIFSTTTLTSPQNK